MMQRFLHGASALLTLRKRHPPVGAMPGTLVTAPTATPPVIRVISYDPEQVTEWEAPSVEALAVCQERPGVSWIDVHGLGDEGVLRQIGELFQLHPLALEDAVNIPQRPKSESYEHQHLFITRMARVGADRQLDVEQVSIFLGRTYVLTLQERPGDVFDPVRRRIRAGRGLIRRTGPDYLAYALIDTVLDGYYPVLEAMGDQINDLEERILARPTPAAMRGVHQVRRELLGLRRAVWPQREAVLALIREESPLVSDVVRQYLRDCHDHAVQLVDVVETYRELATGLMDLYLSGLGQRTNEVMKVLTIMASTFIPLTFLAGLYGMNFEFLPELKFHYAYPILLGLMLAIAIGMLVFFRRRGWLGSNDDEEKEEAGAPEDTPAG